jgi:hypothetical protein
MRKAFSTGWVVPFHGSATAPGHAKIFLCRIENSIAAF